MLKSVNGGKTYVRPLPSEEVVTIDGIHHVRPVVTKVLETVHEYVDVAAGYPSASGTTPLSPSTSDMKAVTDGTTMTTTTGSPISEESVGTTRKTINRAVLRLRRQWLRHIFADCQIACPGTE